MNQLSWLAMLLAASHAASAALTAPGIANATGESSSQIIWHWTDPNTTEQGYRVYDAASGGALLATLTTNATSWTETGLAAGQRCTRYVCAYLLSAESSRVQLPSAMASYPVTWHPTNSLQARAIADTWIAAGFPDRSWTNDVVLRCGYANTPEMYLERRSLVQFEESTLPAASLWRMGFGRASLSMYATVVGSPSPYNVSAFRATLDWDETQKPPAWYPYSTNKENTALTSLGVGDKFKSYTWQWDPAAIGMPVNHRGLMFIADLADLTLYSKTFASKDNTNGYPVPTMSLEYYLPVNPGWVTNFLLLAGVGDGRLDTATYATQAGLTGDTELYGNSTKSYGNRNWVAAWGDTTDVPGFSDHYGWNLNSTSSPYNMGVSNCALFNLYVNSSAAAGGCYLRCGSGNGVRVIVNGATVDTDDATRDWGMEQSVFGPFNLNAGWNRVLIKVRNGAANSGLKAVRFSNADATVWSGSALSFAVDDTTAPGNPTVCTEAQGVSSASWQSTVSAPAFTWSGAEDVAAATEGASGIRGYKVYFGPSASGTPAAFQTAATYSPGAQTEGTYYLRVSTVDNAMNESEPVTLFSFQYDSASPSGVSLGFGPSTPYSITVTGAGTDGGSGIDADTGYTYRLADAPDSGATNAAYTWTGLTPNTLYSNFAVVVSDRAGNTALSVAQSQWTLSLPPAPDSVVPDNSSPCGGTPVAWTAAGGFGPGKVQYYRYAWDQLATHTWSDTEPQWSTGTLATTPTTGGAWYLHLKGYNGADVGNGSYDYALAANTAPIAENKTLTTAKNTAATIASDTLLAGATGASSLMSVSTSTPGAAVTFSNGVVTYTPPTDFTGADTFTFLLVSSAGCYGTGTVTVTVDAGKGQSPTVVYVAKEGDQFVARFAGTPGETYTIEAASSASGPWTKLGSNITVSTTDQGWGVGVFEIRDQMSGGEGFYRTVWPAY